MAGQRGDEQRELRESNGHLMYDPVGTGAAEATLFATLATNQVIQGNVFRLFQ